MKNAYKIKPEIKEFIIQKAKVEPEIDSRKLSLLLQEQFRVNVSKSSISAILKKEGLNKAVGRPRLLPQPQTLLTYAVDKVSAGAGIDILSLKFLLEDKTSFFLDASCHSLWSTQHIPGDFSQPALKVKEYILGSVLSQGQPLVLQTSAGFHSPTPAFLNFLTCFLSKDLSKAIKSIELYTKVGELYETVGPPAIVKRYFIFGLWPWQYKNREGCFSYLRQAILKMNGREILTLITNIEERLLDNPKILNNYLKRWPNPEANYQYFLNKIRDSRRL